MPIQDLEKRLLWLFVLVLTVAVVLGLVARLIGAEAKEILSIATAVAGLATVAVGLGLSVDAFKLLYDKERAKKIAARRAAGESIVESGAYSADGTDVGPVELLVADVARASATATEAGAGFDVSIDFNELLPKLIRSAAGLAIAVLLLGTLMLLGASFSSPAARSSAAPGGSGSLIPSSSPAQSPGPS